VTRALLERAPRLDHEPWDLGALPTPIEPLVLPGLPDGLRTWVKREDLSHPIYGGNKVRKLSWLLPRVAARGGTMVTLGAAGSHHIIASAIHGRARDIKVHGVMVAQPDSEHVRENLRLSLSLAHRLWPCRGTLDVPWQAWKALRAAKAEDGHAATWIGPGGSSPVGSLGWVEAALELAEQVSTGEVPPPTDLFVPAGSCGTAAGLFVGLALAGLDEIRLHAVRVTETWMANHRSISRLARRTRRLLVAAGAEVPKLDPAALVVHHGFCGDGYGHLTEGASRALGVATAAGLNLETTYTAKALAGLLEVASRGETGPEVMFVDTVSSASLDGLLAEAPAEVPEGLRSLLL